MPKATFYTHVNNYNQFIPRLITRVLKDRAQLLVWLNSKDELNQLDKHLWHFENTSFLAHEKWDPSTPIPTITPVILACDTQLPNINASLTILNLSNDFWSQAPTMPNRVLEIISGTPESLENGRNRFRAYKQAHFEIEHHNMQNRT